MARIRAAGSLPTGGSRSADGLGGECQQRYEAIRQHTIEGLIGNAWLEAEAQAQHVTLTSREVEQGLGQFERERYPSAAAFHAFLTSTGESVADELALERATLLSSKLNQGLIGKDGPTGADKLTRRLPDRWASKTNCRSGYIVPGCKQYKGPLPPPAL